MTTTAAGSGIALHHPPTWVSYPYGMSSGMGFATLFFLSTQPLHKPCIHVYDRHGSRVVGTCAPLLRRLTNNGLLIQWNSTQLPDRDPIDRAPGAPTALATRAAKVQVLAAPKFCSSVGGKTLMTVAIGASAEPRSQRRWYVTACLGPKDIDVNETDVLTMLNTATLPRR
ncbi:MAG: hypothetical protein ACR2F6_05450 [Mycobacteriales bacterium]